jgi:formate dehydrogenase subunit beta
MSLETSLREIARKLLEEGQVDVIIGYEKGSLPLQTTPCFIDDADDVDRLVWNESCGNNLAKYLVDRKDKAGVVAKGCDARSIVMLVVEKQVERDKVVIIGVPCSGIIDRRKIVETLEGREMLEATIKGDKVVVNVEGSEEVFAKEQFLCESCQTCEHRNAPIYDVFVGEKAKETKSMGETSLSELEKMTASERWSFFKRELGKCIRCYACREVCPLCYCEECFVDQTMPSWLGKTDDESEVMFYHVTRALHLAGRCVDCGACSRACPMGINLRNLNRRVEKRVKELYNYEAGLSFEETPPLATFKLNDPQEFIK